MEDNLGLAKEVRLWVAQNPGRRFAAHTLDTELGVYTARAKNNRWKILTRLQDEGLIEPYGGSYRVIYNSSTEIDYLNASEDDILDFKWTFGIQNYALLMPKNIAIVFGAKDAGKTALLLDTTRRNQDKHIIHFWSSEMGALELKRRLQRFDDNGIIPLNEWKFKPIERSFDFQDVVALYPDDIHIIDFLEIHTDFAEVGKPIFEIWNKLRKGVAIIALQKNPGASLPRGGTGALEKARIAISLDKGEASIMVGKNWAKEDVNPVGQKWNFKLVGGCKFITL